MSIYTDLKDGISQLPIAEIHKARAELARDLADANEKKLAAAEKEITSLTARVMSLHEQATALQKERDEARQSLESLRHEHAEEVVIHEAIEFRKGKRTLEKWTAFCPKCHTPAKEIPTDTNRARVFCLTGCGWFVPIQRGDLNQFTSSLGS